MEAKPSMRMVFITEPRYRVTFSLSTVFGWMAGVFLEGKALVGEQNLLISLTMVLFGGLSGALMNRRSWQLCLTLLVVCTAYVALLGQLTACYLHFRGWVYTPELLVPCALALLPFVWGHKRFGKKAIIRRNDCH